MSNLEPESQPLQVSVPSTGSSGELKLWQQVDALRELLQHGSRLLGDVVSFVKAAEDAVDRLAAEKELLACHQHSLEEERCRANQAAEKALARMEVQQRELSSMREEMERLRQLAAANINASSDPSQLADLEQRLRATELELQRTRLHLDQERERRNRAISLIRPNPSALPKNPIPSPSAA